MAVMQAGDGVAGDLARTTVGLVARLRAAIVDGTYPPGAPLSEVSLADTFGVSRTPVREALKQLEVEGLINIKPRVGTFVRQPSRREVAELFELKEALEGLAANLLARRGRVPQVDELERNLELTRRAVDSHDEAAHSKLVHDFHQLLVKGADNSKLSEHYSRLMNQLAYPSLVRATLSHKGRPSLSFAEHEEVVGFIVQKDPAGAEFAMRNHVATSGREVMADPRLFVAEGSPPPAQ